MDTESLLRVKDLRICVSAPGGSREVVRGVSLSVRPGETLGLIGESGSGKSMTCLAIMDLLPGSARVTGGTVRMGGGSNVRRGSDAAMIIQNPASCFDPVMSIRGHFRETLAALGRPSGIGPALDSLAEAGFDAPASVLSLYPFQMSGGMLQRVMIAMAMLSEARLILADEPTTDLDMPAQARVLDLLDGLRKSRSLGVLLVTHDLSVAARLADTVAVMREGRIVETGSVRRVFESPAHEYTRTLLAAHHDLHTSLGSAMSTLTTKQAGPDVYEADGIIMGPMVTPVQNAGGEEEAA